MKLLLRICYTKTVIKYQLNTFKFGIKNNRRQSYSVKQTGNYKAVAIYYIINGKQMKRMEKPIHTYALDNSKCLST